MLRFDAFSMVLDLDDPAHVNPHIYGSAIRFRAERIVNQISMTMLSTARRLPVVMIGFSGQSSSIFRPFSTAKGM